MYNNGHGRDDVPETGNGLLMMPRGDKLTTTSYSLNDVNSKETRTKTEDGSLPPSIPTEMLSPEHTRPTPALKLWPLAVLVFYSESS
jgi:hypothetical protein